MEYFIHKLIALGLVFKRGSASREDFIKRLQIA